MVRIIWGIFFVAAGLYKFYEIYLAFSISSGVQQFIGKMPQIIDNQLIQSSLISAVFGISLCAIGSFLIYFGQFYVFSMLRSEKQSERPDQRDGWII